jgi:signal transduction histidine kinase
MFISGDTFILNLLNLILPTLIILLGTIIYSYKIINRYSKALKRLYSSSFRGVDTERKRIATELHDHLAVHTIAFYEHINSLKSMLTGNQLTHLQKIETNFNLFNHKTHQIIEYMYPRVLENLDWEGSFKQLAYELTMGSIRVDFESFATSSPKNDWLFHTYWAIKEVVTNAIRHGNAKKIQITAIDEDKQFILAVHYLATDAAKKWLASKPKSKKGLGNTIIQDRLSIAGAKMNIEIFEGVVTQSIILKNENINLR